MYRFKIQSKFINYKYQQTHQQGKKLKEIKRKKQRKES